MDFLVNISVDDQLMPRRLFAAALTGSTLLFVGYRIADWNFRVLLRSLSRYMESGLQRTHFAVITPPQAAGDLQGKAQEYPLGITTKTSTVRVFWGNGHRIFGSAKTTDGRIGVIRWLWSRHKHRQKHCNG
jgi:hypothetical protein